MSVWSRARRDILGVCWWFRHTDTSSGQCDNAKSHLDVVRASAGQNHFHLDTPSSRQDQGRQSENGEGAKGNCSQGLALYSDGNQGGVSS